MNHSLKDIFNNSYVHLCNYAAAILKDKHAAEDVVQSVFIQLWENDKILTLQNPAPYLLRCVKYKCIDYLRSKKNRREVLMKELPDFGREEHHLLTEEDIVPLITYFASKLPPRMGQVFLMSRTQGLSYKEIATTLNISIKTVENQMGSALKKLSTLLKEYQYLPALLFFFIIIIIQTRGRPRFIRDISER